MKTNKMCLQESFDKRDISLMGYLLSSNANLSQRHLSANALYKQVLGSLVYYDIEVADGYDKNDVKDLLKIAEMLLHYKADVNTQSIEGRTLLHYISIMDTSDYVKLCLKYNPDVNLQDLQGCTALIYATFKCNFESVKLLVDHGANVNIADQARNTPLHDACSLNDEKIAELLLQRGASINALNLFQLTPLMLIYMKTSDYLKSKDTSEEKKRETLMVFLKYNPDVNAINFLGDNILTLSSKFEDHQMIIIEYLAKMETLNLSIHQSLLNTISQKNELNKHFTECREELLMARNARIHDDYSVTFYNALVDDEKKLFDYVGSKGVVQCYEKFDLEKTFPIYGPSMKKNMSKAIEKRFIYDKSAESLRSCLRMDNTNRLITKKILGYLEMKDLENLSKL